MTVRRSNESARGVGDSFAGCHWRRALALAVLGLAWGGSVGRAQETAKVDADDATGGRPVETANPFQKAQDFIVPRYTASVPSGDAAARHDGGLPYVVGVQEVQIVRSMPSQPARTDGHPFDYRHHPFLAWWGGRFWAYHIGAVGSDETSKRGVLQWSTDGINWSVADSMVAFQKAEHQRAAFYVAPNKKLLVTTWAAGGEDQRGKRGSRLVREVRGPNDLGPVYLVKANVRGAFDGLKVKSFDTSTDPAFVAACRAMLDDRIYRQQWQEEDEDESFYVVGGLDGSTRARGFAWYTLDDGRIVGMWKGPHLSVATPDQWKSGNVPPPLRDAYEYDGQKLVSYDQFGAHGGSKQWGQRTSDGRFAMVFNSPGILHARWPLVVTTSADGLDFNTPILCVSGDVNPQRYGQAKFDMKDAGPQYVRGIEPTNPLPPDQAMWLIYSITKEDIWVNRVPVPIRSAVSGTVDDAFARMSVGGVVTDWNIRSARFAPVGIVAARHGGEAANVLRLADEDNADYAKAVRVIEPVSRGRIEVTIVPHQNDTGELHVELTDAVGRRPVRLRFGADAKLSAIGADGNARELGGYKPNQKCLLQIEFDAAAATYDVIVDGTAHRQIAFAEPTDSVERFELRTGAYRLDAFDRVGHYGTMVKTVLPGADDSIRRASYDVTQFRTLNP
jgi:hypothetical protein